MDRSFTCDRCKKSFVPKYPPKKTPKHYCSNYCKVGTRTKEELETAIRALIRANQRYTNCSEIRRTLKVSPLILAQKQIHIKRLNESEGFYFERSGPKTASNSTIKKAAKQIIVEAGRYLRAYEIAEKLGISHSTLLKRKISPVEINRSVGYTAPDRQFESAVGNVLDRLFNGVVREKKFEGLVSPQGYPLRFDFWIQDSLLLVEADGKQHDDTKWKTAEALEYQKQCDQIKNQYAKERGYILVRIPYGKVYPERIRDHLSTVLKKDLILRPSKEYTHRKADIPTKPLAYGIPQSGTGRGHGIKFQESQKALPVIFSLSEAGYTKPDIAMILNNAGSFGRWTTCRIYNLSVRRGFKLIRGRPYETV